MTKFNPSPKTLVVNELIEQGYTVDYDDALRLCHELQDKEQTDGKIAIGLAAVGIIGAGVTLAFCGAVAPILVPIAAIGVGMSGVWNHPIRATRRDDEADFLRANPSIVSVIESKLQSDEAPFKVAAAYLECFRAWRNTGQPLVLPVAGSNSQIAPSHPTDEELQTIGNRLCDRLKAVGKFADLEQIGQRVKAGDLKGGLKMAISANDLNAASFLDSFPGKADLYDWASDAMAAVIPTAEKELSVEEFIDTTPQGRLTDSSEAIAIEILDGLVASRRSTLLIGGTGSGKSVTQSYLLVNLLKRCPDGEVFVISQKADAFAGLSSVGRVVLFDQFNPGETLSTIDRVWTEYDRRRKLPEQNRSGLPPVRLLLCDWLSINAALEACAKDPEIKESRYLSKLIDIIYNGRELNVCLWVDLQSFNLAAIGMKADSNSRKNFNVIGLGNYYVDEAGGINESYGVLSNMIQNKYFVDNDVEREKLMREFNRLKSISKANQRPVMFTTLEPARVALAADIRAYKAMQVVTAKQAKQAQPSQKTKPADDPWQEPARSDAWQSEQAIPVLTTDQKFQCLTNALATMPSLSVASICSSLGLDRAEAFQLAVVYAFRHKNTTIYDPKIQALVKK